jgi:dTDP-4-amino-4,6-dideoxygalactose transaminase
MADARVIFMEDKTPLMNDVPLFDPRAVNAGFDLKGAVARVLDRHWYVMGDEVNRFEAAFAAYCGVPHCISLANGTDALELALRAAGVAAGDRVMLAANAGYYGSTAVRQIGAVPVYVDVDESNLCLDPNAVARAIGDVPPKVILVTHLYGQLAEVESLAKIARERGIVLIEDCAQAHGARRAGKVAGSFGDLACFSFYPTKNLGAVGDGGAVVCRDETIASRVRSLRQYGWSQKYRNDLPGGRNSRLDEVQAAVLSEKLPALDRHNQARRDIASAYCEAFAGLPVRLPAACAEDHVAHLFVIRTASRDALREHLRAKGIASDIHYPVADHQQSVAQVAGNELAASLPVTERACAEVLSLPCYPGMSSEQAGRVIDAVRSFFVDGQGK